MKLNLSPLPGILFMSLIMSQCSVVPEYPTTGSVNRLSPEMDAILEPGILPEILADGFEWCEGPLWLPDQNILIFSDIPQNTIFQWSEKDGLSTYLKPSGHTGIEAREGESGSNGLLLDPEGKLVLCQHGDRRMASMNASLAEPEPNFTTLADKWEDKKFNSPNDAVFSKSGELFFTDPAYGMELGFDDPNREMDFTGVFRLHTGGEVSLVTNKLSAPNGIALSPDEKHLYVANSGRSSGLIWEIFDRASDGSYTNERLFYDAGPAGDSLRGAPDGLAVRSDGIIFATGPGGVWIFEPDGTHLGIVRTGQATSNCTLDAREKYLYMTADNFLMRIKLKK
ncbi:MAG: SMP-30/gluconolactonase/LRE family protein [Bacteroides sp.]|nr:SMP-30/gluconolactonase/LRE family protein [Bacteroides sp.]